MSPLNAQSFNSNAALMSFLPITTNQIKLAVFVFIFVELGQLSANYVVCRNDISYVADILRLLNFDFSI
jgi:hypothetical protein